MKIAVTVDVSAVRTTAGRNSLRQPPSQLVEEVQQKRYVNRAFLVCHHNWQHREPLAVGRQVQQAVDAGRR